jgi:hypothetical protein
MRFGWRRNGNAEGRSGEGRHLIKAAEIGKVEWREEVSPFLREPAPN